jgi:branched-chain amino acid transport system permease protein
VTGEYALTVGVFTGIWVLLAMGLNLVSGYAGQPHLGHAALYGIGAYASALLTTRSGLDPWVAIPLSVLLASAIGLALSAVTLRVRDDFLAITTMGVNFVVVAVFLYVPFFGGAYGIGGVPPPRLLGVAFDRRAYFALVLGAVVLGALLDRWILRSWLGAGLVALRDDELAAEASGVDTRRFKVVAFGIGSGYAGLAGALYAHFAGFITPQDFGFPVSITVLCMVVLGGIGTLRGAVTGAVLLSVLPELFRFLLNYRMLLYGLLLVLAMRYQPQGLLGEGSALVGFLRRRAVGRPPVPRAEEVGRAAP